MSTETAVTILTIVLVITSFLLGIYFGLTGWPQLKKPTHTDIKAAAWEEGYQDGKHDQIMEPMIEAGMSTPTTNPYKEQTPNG